jgi:hypothetical protein
VLCPIELRAHGDLKFQMESFIRSEIRDVSFIMPRFRAANGGERGI